MPRTVPTVDLPDLTGRRAVVTGGSDGIGLVVATRLAAAGADGFYKGEMAGLIEREMKAGGGLMTRADLAGYRAKLRAPVRGTYRGYDVYAAPPPSGVRVRYCPRSPARTFTGRAAAPPQLRLS